MAWVRTTLHRGYVQADEHQLRRAMHGAKVMIVNSPSNPTGCSMPDELLELVVRLANELDVLLISDEVYEYFIYEGEFRSLATFPGRAGGRSSSTVFPNRTGCRPTAWATCTGRSRWCSRS